MWDRRKGGTPIKPIRAAACLAIAALASFGGPSSSPPPAITPYETSRAAHSTVPTGELASVTALPDEPAAARAEPAPRALEPAVTVVSSWFGPGLYGNRTACGLVLTEGLAGVAHRTLPCGTIVTLRYGASTVAVPVVDRGPFIAGREFDLTFATKVALGCPDICRTSWLR